MEPASLSEEEQRLLRSFIAAGQRSRWQEWNGGAILLFLVVAMVAGSQWLLRWLPAQLEARGLAICMRGQTLHHGALWVPDSLGFSELLRGPAAVGMLFAYYFGMAGFICYLQQRHAHRVARVLARLFPDQADRA